ncbi:MAG: insulinase family protein [Melioribacteraceae bacterium]|nr:insulinase family protein [Melioribacteraceae bacterium]
MEHILNIDYKKIKLSNGLELILYKDNSLPIVSVNIWYKVGSANERKGKTGFAHLFEHMMFQGSENVPKEMHFRYIQEAGGTLNGSTSNDRTNYYETVPSNFLEMVLWLESDRMGFLLPSLNDDKLKNQKEVVMNERRQRYDNQPYGLAWELIFSNLFKENHPYHWPVIGWMDDISNFRLDDIKEFFKTYYSPSNASMVIAGDIDYDETESLVKKYFDEIPSSNTIPKIVKPEVNLTENIFIEHPDNVELSRIYLAWHSPKLYHQEDAALDILSTVLSGSKNSRLYKSLVFEKQIAQDVTAFQYSGNYDGVFVIVATAKPDVSLDELKKNIFIELINLYSNGITEHELTKAKNNYKSGYIFSLQDQAMMADYLNNYNCNLNEPNSFLYDLNRYNKLNTEDVRFNAEKYLSKNFVELRIIPKK